MLGDCTITVSHARGNDRGALYEKEPKTSSPARTIPLVARILQAPRTMRAAVSCLGHASVSKALNIYADVGPDAKRATVSTEQDCLDVDPVASPIECDLFGNEPDLQPVAPHFHIDQLEAMLTQA